MSRSLDPQYLPPRNLHQQSVILLGATGSIGQSTADVIASAPENFDVRLVSAARNAAKLADTALRLKAAKAVIADPAQLPELLARLNGSGIAAAAGPEALSDAIAEGADVCMAAISGMAGLEPLLLAAQTCRKLAIANKEPLVAAGALVMSTARRHECKILPVDSEHNAIFQVFDFDAPDTVEKIWLTASGGPFRDWPAARMAAATPDQALRHPIWTMGPKISIDSATLMNKALEVIEAHVLFGLPASRISVVIHPQAVIHSMVEYVDGSILAQMGASDMRTPIAHALAWPRRMATPGRRLDLFALSGLDFESPDPARFPALGLAYAALAAGPAACLAMNAANEVAVAAFLAGEIGYMDIMRLVEFSLTHAPGVALNTLPGILEADRCVRDQARAYIDCGFNAKAMTNVI